MFTIRTLVRTSNSRLLTTCKEPDKKYNIVVPFIICGLAAVPTVRVVKYQYDKSVYNREMVKYEERRTLWREIRDQPDCPMGCTCKDWYMDSTQQESQCPMGCKSATMDRPPQKPDPPMISLFDERKEYSSANMKN